MIQRIRDYVIALGVVLTAYLLYAQTVVRLVEPKPIARTTSEPPTEELPDRRNPYAHLFQPGDWELDSPKILETNGGTLIFRDYRPMDQGRLEIRPCTLVLYSRDDGDGEVSQSGRPIVVRAYEGAMLQFDEDLDLARGQFGRLIGGRILGDIRVFSPESAPGAGDGLELVTRNLQIDRLRVWTPHEVKFRYGPSYGSGQDLVMNLSPSEAVSKGKTKAPPIGGVESVQLSQVKEIHLESNQGSVLPPAGDAKDQPIAKQPPVRITCDGPLRFDVNRRVATFDDNVLIQRLLPNAPPDRLHCEQLAIFMRPADAPKTQATTKQALPVSTGNIERIVAVGKPVVLDAPSQSAHTEAERLEYNLQTRQVLLKSLDSGARVLLRRATDEFTAPELAYELVEGRRIGKLWAPGPGRLMSSTGAGNEQRTFAAEWKKEIRIRPHEANQLISLTDGAKIDVQGQGSFEADELHFWLLEIPGSEVKTSGEGLGGMGQGRIVPDRLLATGHVQATSPQLSAEVERLEAWFQQVPVELPAAAPVVEQTPPADQLILGPAAGSAVREPTRPIVRIQEPLPAPSGSPLQSPAPSDKPVQHFHVTGEIVRMQVIQSGKQSSVEQISVEGEKVRITETHTADGQEPLWLAGTKLDLEGGTGPNALITVSGEPAIVSARGMSLRSKTLKLSRRDNRVTVEQEGSMTLPMQQDFQGQRLQDAEQLSIAWNGSMVFDGLTAKFRRNVLVRGTTFWAAADELQAMLTSRIDFSRSNQSGKSPEIRRLALTGGAELENRSFNPDDGRQQSVEHMSAQSLEVDQVSGAIQGIGPGWLSRIQVGSPSLPGSGLETATSPATPASPSAAASLTYLRVDFREGLDGNLKQRQIAFHDQVQCLFGPVSHWEDQLDPTSRDALGDRGMILTADRLQLADFIAPGATKGSLEMTATGQTRVEGRDFTARSHRITYTASKSQLVLEGDGRQEAEIHHQFQNSVAAQKILFWQNTNTIQIDGAKNINIGPTGPRTAAPPRSPRDAIQPR